MQNLLQLYKDWRGKAPLKAETLPKAGSNRQYVRLYEEGGRTLIGVIGNSTAENRCFVYLASHFASKGLPTPRVYAFSDDETCYLQQDLGNRSLYDALKSARERGFNYDETDFELLRRTIQLLPRLQVLGAEGLNYDCCLEPTHFDKRAAMFDLNYFKYSFLKTTDLPFNEVRLEDDLELLALKLVGGGAEGHHFLYRDFQARNIMLSAEGEPFFIDFQGGMKGPLQYDVASFLWQASARYPQALRERLIDAYLEALREFLPEIDEARFREQLRLFVLFRTLQVLGAYGLRGFVERKKYFLDSIPSALSNLREAIATGAIDDLPYLKKVLLKLCALNRFQAKAKPAATAAGTASKSKYDGKGKLVVRVFSFSYKKGIPEDCSGNGGGYVFDCRSTHNPGRYEPYKKLTGLDQPVIDFLEEDGEILPFLDRAMQLADAHVERYIQRGFTDLMFSFGCTGGQHRSVYSAQHLAEHLHAKFGIEVRICHREQGITTTLETKENK